METILTLNSGQHILFGFVVTSLQGKTDRIFSLEENIRIAKLVKELTEVELYDGYVFDCPDVTIMTEPQNAYKIFDEWFDENEMYFEDFFMRDL